MKQARLPLLSGLLGGGVVAVLVLALGLGGSTHKTTTVVQQAPLSATPASDTSALTARDIYKRDAPGVVLIRSQIVEQTDSPFGFGQQSQSGTATGSGFVIDKTGEILTNAHVIDGASKVTVQFADDKTVDATVVGKDSSTDLALLKVDTDGLDLHPLALGSAKQAQVGDPVIAIGNPFGQDRTLTTGVVSALQRKIQAPNGFAIDNVVQTDAAINPGNSGGPLLDESGHVIGVNSQIETGGSSSGNVGVGFAVPSNSLRQIVPVLEQGKTIAHPWLGVSTTASAASGVAGAQIETVASDSPAEAAGLQQGDVVVAIGSEKVTSSDDLGRLIDRGSIGDRLTLKVLRNGSEMSVDVTLRERPTSVP